MTILVLEYSDNWCGTDAFLLVDDSNPDWESIANDWAYNHYVDIGSEEQDSEEMFEEDYGWSDREFDPEEDKYIAKDVIQYYPEMKQVIIDYHPELKEFLNAL